MGIKTPGKIKAVFPGGHRPRPILRLHNNFEKSHNGVLKGVGCWAEIK